MPYSDNVFFWPAVIVIGIVVIALFSRFLVRVALFVVALLVIWYCLFYVGLAPSPQEFFKAKTKNSEKLEEARSLNQKQTRRCSSIEKLMKADIPFFSAKLLAKRKELIFFERTF